MKMPSPKHLGLGAGLITLVLLNVAYYSGGESHHSSERTSMATSVQPIKVPAALVGREEYRLQRDIFSRVVLPEEMPEPQEIEEVEPVEPILTKVLDADVSSDLPEIYVRGVVRRQGNSYAMIEYQGQFRVVREGDGLDQNYFVKRISDSQVYVTRRQ